MSHGEVPSQHDSTITISPFVTNRNDTKQRRVSHNYGANANGERLDLPSGRDAQWNGTSTMRSPYHSIVNSPLLQKVNPNATIASLTTTPYHSNSLLNQQQQTSINKNSLFTATIPSTLRKISLQRDFKDVDGNDNLKDGIESNDHIILNPNANNNTTNNNTNLVTNDIDISQLTAIEKLRLWRHDALMQHKYKTAEFVGNKIYSMTNDPNDAFWLAQVHYSSGSYIRVVELLSHNNLDATSIICRYLMALSLVKLQKYDDALDIVGESNPFAEATDQVIRKHNDGGIKLESSLCYLRGKIYIAQNNLTKAKDSLKEALLVDVKNFEAFEELTSKSLLTPLEEWDLIKALDFSNLDDNEEMIKCLYTIRLSNTMNLGIIKKSKTCLIEDYDLKQNTDLIKCDIQLCHTGCKFKKCLELCEIVLEVDEFNNDILPIYISCLYELNSKNKLFQLSHKLAENCPKNAITWFSVATYYMTVNRINEARKYFSKSSILDPNFAPAWLGFSHTFAIEGEHDQAISAYSTASRFFLGIHLPNLFLGMQYMALNTLSLAEEYFTLAYDICPHDPLLLNEMGVLFFKKNDLPKAKRYLKKALEAVKDLDCLSKTAISIQMNLAHTYRRLGDIEMAIKCFKHILEISGKDADIFCSLGFLYLKTKQLQKAIDHLHSSLSIKSSNSVAQELLTHALELNVSMSLDSDHPLVVNAKLHNQNELIKLTTFRKRLPANIRDPNFMKKVRKMDKFGGDQDSYMMEME